MHKKRPKNLLQAKKDPHPQLGRWFLLDVTRLINILFSLISCYFSFPFLMFPPQDSLLGGDLN
jgi:hypothetical protein